MPYHCFRPFSMGFSDHKIVNVAIYLIRTTLNNSVVNVPGCAIAIGLQYWLCLHSDYFLGKYDLSNYSSLNISILLCRQKHISLVTVVFLIHILLWVTNHLPCWRRSCTKALNTLMPGEAGAFTSHQLCLIGYSAVLARTQRPVWQMIGWSCRGCTEKQCWELGKIMAPWFTCRPALFYSIIFTERTDSLGRMVDPYWDRQCRQLQQHHKTQA